jgi:hypothetical protein
MTRRETFNKGVVCVVLLAFTFGCTTTRPLTTTSPQALARSIGVGDKIEIKRQDGSRLAFEVTEVSGDGIGGSSAFVPYNDMQKVSKIQINMVGTGLLVLLGVGLLSGLEKNLEKYDCGPFYWPSDECDEYDE